MVVMYNVSYGWDAKYQFSLVSQSVFVYYKLRNGIVLIDILSTNKNDLTELNWSFNNVMIIDLLWWDYYY